MTTTIKNAIEFFKACKEAGKQIELISEANGGEYSVYRVEANKEVAEIHFNHKDDYALIFRSAK